MLVTTQSEAFPFKGFMLKEDMVVLERQNPDTLGVRFILMSFSGISAVRMVDPLKAESFASLGFEGEFSM